MTEPGCGGWVQRGWAEPQARAPASYGPPLLHASNLQTGQAWLAWAMWIRRTALGPSLKYTIELMSASVGNHLAHFKAQGTLAPENLALLVQSRCMVGSGSVTRAEHR